MDQGKADISQKTIRKWELLWWGNIWEWESKTMEDRAAGARNLGGEQNSGVWERVQLKFNEDPWRSKKMGSQRKRYRIYVGVESGRC